MKAGLDSKVTSFFKDFLVRRKTNYVWNKFSSLTYEVNVGVSQESTLSPILSALYLSPLLYILEKCLNILNILISFISFIDDSIFISQNKSIDVLNSQLFYSYNVLSGLLDKFGLNIEHSKTEMFHFNRSHGIFNPPPLDLSPLGGPILHPKKLMEILGVHIRPKALIPPTYWLLLKQGYLHGQMHETSWEFNTRNQPNSETPIIQVLHLTYSAIWVLIIVL